MFRTTRLFFMPLLVSLSVLIMASLQITPALADGVYCPFQAMVQQINYKASENSWIGSPVQGPWVTPNDDGCFTHFEKASIYVSNSTPAVMIYGAIRAKWGTMGYERSYLGYPTTDERDSPAGDWNQFQNGIILWKQGASEAFSVINGIYSEYARLGFQNGALGYPTSDEENWWSSNDTVGGQARVSWFDHGAIFWLPNPDGDGSSTLTTLTYEIEGCWSRQYNASGKQYFRFPERLTSTGPRSFELSFADAGRGLNITLDGNGHLLTCSMWAGM